MKISRQSTPEIIQAPARTIVGTRMTMTLAENKTQALWQNFAPKIKTIKNKMNEGSFSIQVYQHQFGKEAFTPETPFEKWAGVAVNTVENLPSGLEVLEIPAGRWAVFLYKGTTQDFRQFAMYIYGTWLPQSGEQLAERPHFEIMPPGYLGPNNPEAEEYVWVPIL